MPNPLTLEVTILITVQRSDYECMSDDMIRGEVEYGQAAIYNCDWDSVSVRVAEPKETSSDAC